MMAAIRSIFGENVKTPDIRVMVDQAELTPAGVRAVIARLRLRNGELEQIIANKQNQILALLRENARLKREASLWLDDWIKINVRSDAQKVDIFKA